MICGSCRDNLIFKARTVEALKRTFSHRKTELPKKSPLFAEEIYDERSDRQGLWKAFLRKNRVKDPPEKLKEIALAIENFLIEPIEAIHEAKELQKEWKTQGPWRQRKGHSG